MEPEIRRAVLANGRLRDGTRVCIRDVGEADRERVLDFLHHVTRDSLELRYLAACQVERAASDILAPGLPEEHVSLLVELAEPGRESETIAHGEFLRTPTDHTRAEVAFLVADDHQGRGAATLLLLHLARRARRQGIGQFDAITLPSNRAMMDVFMGAGFPCRVRYENGLEAVSLAIEREPETGIVLVPAPRPPRKIRA
jgi:GNAT superfamily N-acetyltransferase